VSNNELRYRFSESDFFLRHGEPSYGDIVLTIWVFGLIINDLKLVFQYGFKEYFLSWSNILNACMYALFIASFSLKYYMMILVSMERTKLNDPLFWNRVTTLSATDTPSQIDIYQTFYWLNDGMTT